MEWSHYESKINMLVSMMSNTISTMIRRVEMVLFHLKTVHSFGCAKLLCRANFVKNTLDVPTITGEIEFYSSFLE